MREPLSQNVPITHPRTGDVYRAHDMDPRGEEQVKNMFRKASELGAMGEIHITRSQDAPNHAVPGHVRDFGDPEAAARNSLEAVAERPTTRMVGRAAQMMAEANSTEANSTEVKDVFANAVKMRAKANMASVAKRVDGIRGLTAFMLQDLRVPASEVEEIAATASRIFNSEAVAHTTWTKPGTRLAHAVLEFDEAMATAKRLRSPLTTESLHEGIGRIVALLAMQPRAIGIGRALLNTAGDVDILAVLGRASQELDSARSWAATQRSLDDQVAAALAESTREQDDARRRFGIKSKVSKILD
ncbi:MAG: hypothetical protein H6729_12975 [Deltaproteobacteria bacterium]|nr:hypothetical protein [Deltaproteobacteria bacterium]